MDKGTEDFIENEKRIYEDMVFQKDEEHKSLNPIGKLSHKLTDY